MRRLWCAARIGGLALTVACSDGATPAVPVESVGFVLESGNVVAGEEFDISVELFAADGSRASGANDQVVLSASDGSGITGPSTVRASNGLAVFRNVALTRAATNIYLTATAGTHAATTNIFNVTPAVASGTRSSVSSSVSIVPTEPTPVVFTFMDAYGNVLPEATVAVSAVSGATFTPSSGTTTAAGSFAAVFLSAAGGSVPVSATVNGTPITIAAPLAVCTFSILTLPGSAAGLLSAASCPISGRPTALYRFTTALAGGASFAVMSNFVPRLDIKTDPPLSTAFAAPNQGASTEWLLPAGTYQLRLGAISGTGAFALTTAFGSGNTGCVRRFLATIGVYSGQALAAGDCDPGDETLVDKYVVYSPNPCSFRVQPTSFTGSIWLMELGTGHFLDGRYGFDIGAEVVFGIPSCSISGGPFEVWVLHDPGETGGAYTLTYTLYPIPAQRAGAMAAPLAHERAAIDPRVLRRLRAMVKGSPTPPR